MFEGTLWSIHSLNFDQRTFETASAVSGICTGIQSFSINSCAFEVEVSLTSTRAFPLELLRSFSS